MRRIIITIVIFVLFSALCGCAAGGKSTSVPLESAAPELYSDAGPTAVADGAAGQEEILDRYLERFGADSYYRDAFIDFKYFILNDSELVCLVAIENAEQTTVVPLESIARVEQTNTGAFTVVTVYDRTGASVSIDLDDAKAAELLQRIG